MWMSSKFENITKIVSLSDRCLKLNFFPCLQKLIAYVREKQFSENFDGVTEDGGRRSEAMTIARFVRGQSITSLVNSVTN